MRKQSNTPHNDGHVCLRKPCIVCAVEAGNWTHVDTIVAHRDELLQQKALHKIIPHVASRSHIRRIISAPSLGIGIVEDGHILQVNDVAKTLMGPTAKEGTKIVSMVADEHVDLVVAQQAVWAPYQAHHLHPLCTAGIRACKSCQRDMCHWTPMLLLVTPLPVVANNGEILRMSLLLVLDDGAPREAK